MASKQALMVLLCGELWRSLSAAIPHNIAMKSNAHTSGRSPTEAKAPLYQLQASALSLQIPGRALMVMAPEQFPTAEPSDDGSWIAALIIGIILVSMIVATAVILLWKCCKRPALVDPNWAGRSPFADGDTPDVFMDCDQPTKRSSVLFMLPWKLKQDTNLLQDPTAPEKSCHCTPSNESSPLPSPAEGCSGASTSAASRDVPPGPTSAAASSAQDSCPEPAASSASPELPPPPDWLREAAEGHSSELSQYQESQASAEEPLPPPPPELLAQEAEEPLPQPTQPL
ncbi:EVI2B protein, partial [Bucco capensis]|nr:EVI2B protein [Bucco capensis]